MHPLTNHVLQLQELTMIRDEQKVARGGRHLEQLDAAIKTMASQLPPDVHAMFSKLHRKDRVVVAPITADNCSLCAMRLPTSLVQSVRQGAEIKCCPNCARLLYQPEDAPRRLSERVRRSEPRKVGIQRFSSHTLMVPGVAATDRDGVIAELAGQMEAEGFVDRADRLVEEALRREAIVSTAVDHGVSFPHVRGVEGGGLALAVGTNRKGLRFDPDNKKLTHIVFLMVIPTAANAFYLKLLAGLAETLTDAEKRKALVEAKTQDELWKALCKITRATIK